MLHVGQCPGKTEAQVLPTQNLEQASDLCIKRTFSYMDTILTAVLFMTQIKQQQSACLISYHYWQFTTSQEFHKLWHQSSFHYNFYPVIGTICQIGKCPACVCQHLMIIMVQEPNESWKNLLNSFYGWCRILITTQV